MKGILVSFDFTRNDEIMKCILYNFESNYIMHWWLFTLFCIHVKDLLLFYLSALCLINIYIGMTVYISVSANLFVIHAHTLLVEPLQAIYKEVRATQEDVSLFLW